MKNTKRNILDSALKLFNENGFVNVRLQHIADEAEISTGNLAYHYVSKQDLLENLYHEITGNHIMLLKELNIAPLFRNMEIHWKNVYNIQQKYKFFYLDTLEIFRSNRKIEAEYRKHIDWKLKQLNFLFKFNMARGVFRKLDNEEDLDSMTELLWMNEDFWLKQIKIRGMKSSEENFINYMWSSFLPLFAEKGKQEYQELIKFNRVML